MNFLRKLYPGSFKLEKKVVKPFVIRVVVLFVLQVVIGAICGVPIGIAMGLAEVTQNLALMFAAVALEIVLMALVTLVCIYLTGGIVVSVLKFVGVIKDAPAEANEVAAEAEAAQENVEE